MSWLPVTTAVSLSSPVTTVATGVSFLLSLWD